MPELRYNKKYKLFVWRADNTFDQNMARDAGFDYDERGAYVTASKYTAYSLVKYASESANKQLWALHTFVVASKSDYERPISEQPEGLEYKGFQRAGVRYCVNRKYAMFGDEPGLGKTIQFIGVANWLNYEKMLVVCPAHLRLNWYNEIAAWSLSKARVQVINTSRQEIDPDATVIISYNMLKNYYPALIELEWDLIGCDESHFLSSAEATRTQIMLGLGDYKKALIERSKKAIFMTGTPIYNRADNLYPVLKRCAPDVIDNMSYWDYISKFCTVYDSGFGVTVTGSKNEEELYTRLRSGFMVRRLKKDVLDQLPDKQYKLAVYDQSNKIKSLWSKQGDFTPNEITDRCKAANYSATPDGRREEGMEKIPAIADYAERLMDSGCKKLLIFAYHQEVVERLLDVLGDYGQRAIYGKTSARVKAQQVSAFQCKDDCRILILNILAAGTGITLTAASDGIFGEYCWNDADNAQVIDRMHRIGQENKVTAHYVAVENTLDATVLSRALEKGEDNSKILDGV